MPEADSANYEQNQQVVGRDSARTEDHADQIMPVEHRDLPISSEQQSQEQGQAGASPLERICQLELALDQSQSQVSELRSQLLEQQTLEAQLVVTEEVANLQHLALTQLKHQLSCQQQALDDQISQARTRDQTVQELLASIETLANEQRIEIESLRSQLSVDRRAIHNNHKQLEKQLIQRQTELQSKQQQVQDLESQILIARTHAVRLEVQLAEQEQHIQELYSRLGDRAYFLNQLEAQLQQAHDALEAQQDLHTSLLQTQALSRDQNTTITALHSKIEALETQLAQHLTMAAQLQQACRELTAERDYYQSRTGELEGHQSALQEQILMQAQQASEYEAAIQYWKDQCITSTRQSQQMKELLERVLPDRPEEVLELLMAIQPQEPSLQSEPPQPIKHLQVDLPAFLRKTLPNS